MATLQCSVSQSVTYSLRKITQTGSLDCVKTHTCDNHNISIHVYLKVAGEEVLLLR